MAEQLTLVAIGSVVIIGEDIKAIITRIEIRPNNHISYECVWWNGRERISSWLCRNEFTLFTHEYVRIGFQLSDVSRKINE